VRGILRLLLPSVVALVVAALIVPLAVLDHRNKQARMNEAEVGEWYCTHVGVRCDGPSSSSIEDHWNTREAAYVAAMVSLTTFAVLYIPYSHSARVLRRRAGVLRRSSL